MVDLILPAAGLATRMRGLPKFLLPIDNKYTTLIENHINNATKNKEIKNIWIPTRPDLKPILESLDLNSVNIITMTTSSMSETVLNTCSIANSKNYMLIMPDTYFDGEQPTELLEVSPQFCDLAIWKIRKQQRGKLGEVELDKNNFVKTIIDKNPDTNFEYSWGSLTFSKEFVKYINARDPHVGYAIEQSLSNKKKITTKLIEGNYYDCGTPDEYIELLKKILL